MRGSRVVTRRGGGDLWCWQTPSRPTPLPIHRNNFPGGGGGGLQKCRKNAEI